MKIYEDVMSISNMQDMHIFRFFVLEFINDMKEVTKKKYFLK